MKRKMALLTIAAMLSLSVAACGSSGDSGSGDSGSGESSSSSGDVANKDKPLVWFNRQPSNSSTGELDTTALNFNENTYYVGFDANQGAELQGTMVKDYIEANIDMFWQSEISDITILSRVREVSAKPWEPVLKKTATSTAIQSEQTQMVLHLLYRMGPLKLTAHLM